MSETVEIHGSCDARFAPLEQAFARNFADGLEIGASLAVYHRGEPVVDLWAGHADRKGTVPWQSDTLANVFSTSKILAILCTLSAIDRQLLRLDEPVATYWPEFGQQAKTAITVREAMTHRALVPGFKVPQPYDVAHDWDRMTALIAAEEPWFERGTLCYHPYSYGFILGELVQRVTGSTVQAFFRREWSDPLSADCHLGLLERTDQNRVAELFHTAAIPFEPDSLPGRIMASIGPPPPGVHVQSTWNHQSAVMPGLLALTNARGLARIGNVLALGGTANGRRYLSQQIVDEARTEQVHAQCPIEGDLRLGLGFGLHGPGWSAPTPDCFHWGGYGGSWLVMDPATQTALAYVMNRCVIEEDVLHDARRDRLWGTYGELAKDLP